MPNDARLLAAMVDAPEPQERGNFAFRKDFASQTKALFESFGAPLAGMSDAPFADMLRVMASFPSYSLGNQSLIALQSPGAQSVSSAERWAALGRRVVRNPAAIHIWAPAKTRDTAPSSNGYARPSLAQAEKIAASLGLRATQGDEFLFDAKAVGDNALWGGSQNWRSVRAVRITDGGDHIAVKLITGDGRALDRRARTMVGLVKSLMQAGSSPNDETIAAYLSRLEGSRGIAPRSRDFFQKFTLVPVYDVSETDGSALPELPAIDRAASLQNLIAYLATQKIEVIVGDHAFKQHASGEGAEIYLNERAEKDTQLAHLTDAAADIISERRALVQGRELLKVERDAVKFVLDSHFGFSTIIPELGRGLAPNVEPHSCAEVVKARLSSVHDIAKELILAANPGYENPLLKALTQARAPAPQPEAIEQPAASVEAPKPAVAKKLETPKPKKASPEGSVAVAIDAVPTITNNAPENFNPFAENAVKDEGADFNPFAEGPGL
jgi:hypothetical protein